MPIKVTYTPWPITIHYCSHIPHTWPHIHNQVQWTTRHHRPSEWISCRRIVWDWYAYGLRCNGSWSIHWLNTGWISILSFWRSLSPSLNLSFFLHQNLSQHHLRFLHQTQIHLLFKDHRFHLLILLAILTSADPFASSSSTLASSDEYQAMEARLEARLAPVFQGMQMLTNLINNALSPP